MKIFCSSGTYYFTGLLCSFVLVMTMGCGGWLVFATGRVSVAGCNGLLKSHSMISVCAVFHHHGLSDSSACEDGCRALATGGR